MLCKKNQFCLLYLVALLSVGTTDGFQTFSRVTRPPSLLAKGKEILSTRLHFAARVESSEKAEETSFLMKPFATASGEIVNPYRVLKVPRSAERKQIREAYRKLSKRYHPDIVRHKEILPGNCNNHQDVEDEWERIQISYNILSEKKSRMQYDRHEVIADPAAAMQRAAMGAAAAGVANIGKGIFQIGSSALDIIIGGDKKNENKKQ
eukprot:CAMPEP_0172370886 /NCGR_PEP_ID=MMETSP1060-20121228/40182_1 /TAXON_ID=37318 /ORGANISM="Pseudo-nitzschia pungens, Strain cf. cingulata" /LENGTH=206 /DNA_ID=CAMNT_0013096329 /DNA_START=43 /DNA_END=663 /DNA_ORIENTATION=-